jgi:hypothetical protein
MNARPWPRALVESCGLCTLECWRGPGVCPRFFEEVERFEFYRRVAAELSAEAPELHELQTMFGARRAAPFSARKEG